MTHHYYTWDDLNTALDAITVDMYAGEWRPDTIVGVAPGGIIPAVVLGERLGVPVVALNATSKNGVIDGESNTWLAEDAYGRSGDVRPRMLVMVDFNRNGDIFKWLMDDWERSVFPDAGTWDIIWYKTVRFAALTENLNSDTSADYSWDKVVTGTNSSYNLLRNDTYNWPWTNQAWLAKGR